jgi:hypothetical protein
VTILFKVVVVNSTAGKQFFKMKYLINPFIRTILILGAWFLCIRKIYIDFDHSYLFDNLIPIVLISLASIISLLSFLVDYLRYKKDKKPVSFISTTVSVLCIATLIITTDRLKQQDRTPTILYASNFYSGLITVAIDFRENGTYKCEKGSFMGDSYYTRGYYSIKDSIIYLDKSNLYELVKTDRLLMKTIPKSAKGKKGNLLKLLFGSSNPDTLPATFLFQLNHQGDTIPSAIVLRVNNDKLSYLE